MAVVREAVQPQVTRALCLDKVKEQRAAGAGDLEEVSSAGLRTELADRADARDLSKAAVIGVDAGDRLVGAAERRHSDRDTDRQPQPEPHRADHRAAAARLSRFTRRP